MNFMLWIAVLFVVLAMVLLVVAVVCPRCKIELVTDAGKAWQWFSMQAMALNVVFLAAWAELPSEFKAALPDWFMPFTAIALLVIAMVVRTIKQKG